MDQQTIIDTLHLLPHPEGGWYKETYRSAETISSENLPERFSGDRVFATGIYFMISGTNFSAFHRIRSDEMWHFYAGAALDVYVITSHGDMKVLKVGPDLARGQSFQAVVPAGCWFASRCSDPQAYSLVGCTVSPGFDFADFEMADRQALTAIYPQYSAIITELTRT